MQRLARLEFKGTMPTCPTAAPEVMLSVTPLYIRVMIKVAVSVLRTRQTAYIKPGNRFEHMKFRDLNSSIIHVHIDKYHANLV